ncbi:MAG: hypothetical protein HY481_02265 [Candidatus Vogelbacteria bacterium]|nr:hypothetical protein [Candidatus Vogelbacteria bacterium]
MRGVSRGQSNSPGRFFHREASAKRPPSFLICLFTLSFAIFVFSFQPEAGRPWADSLFTLRSFAAPNLQINYQGKLTNSSSVAVSDGSYSIVFSLYAAATGGTAIWTETQSVSVTSGLFSVMLGTTTSLANVNFDQTLYLGVNVAADGEMTPRKVLGVAPATFLATAVRGATTTSSFGTTTPLVNTQVTIEATTTTAIPLTVRAAASQSANLFQIQNSAGDNLLFANAGGGLFASSTLQVTGQTTLYGSLFVTNSTSTITNLTMVNATSTNATTTTLYVSGLSTLSGGLLVSNATSTITNLTMFNATSTNATTTTLYVSGSATTTFGGGLTLATGNINLPTGSVYSINNVGVLSATALGSNVTGSSLTSVGALTAGSIASGFGSINIGSNALTAGAGSFSSLTDSGTLSVTGLSTLGAASTTRLSVLDKLFIGTNSTTTIQGETDGTSTIRGFITVTGTNSTSTFSGGLAATFLNLTGTGASSTIAGGLSIAGLESSEPLKVSGTTASSSFAGGLTARGIRSSQHVEITGGALSVNTTVATSTFSTGGLTVGTDKFIVQQTSGRVGIGTTTPSDALTVYNGSFRQAPGNPVEVGSLTLGSNPKSIAVAGRYGYVVDSTDNNLRILDLATSSPAQVGAAFSIGTSPQKITVAGRYAYVIFSGSGLQVIDISNPIAPVTVGTLAIGGNPTDIAVAGRYAYVVDSTSNDLKIIDISNPTTPATVGTLAVGSTTKKIVVSGRYAYVIDSSAVNDFKIIDISNPAAPFAVGTLDFTFGPDAIAVAGRYAYVTNGGLDDLEVIDIVNPAAPVVAGTLVFGDVSNKIKFVAVAGRYAYVTSRNSSDLKIIDILNPLAPGAVGALTFSAAANWALAVSGRYAYVINGTVLRTIDLSGIEVTSGIIHSLEAGTLQVLQDSRFGQNISVRGGLNIGTGGIYSSGPVAISMASTTSTTTVDTLTLTGGSFRQSPLNPVTIVSTTTTNWDPQAVVVQGRYAYSVGNGAGGDDLKIMDVSNPAFPTLAGRFSFGASSPTDVAVSGRYAYVVDDSLDTLKIIDVSNIANPVQAGSLSISGLASTPRVKVQGRYAYVSDTGNTSIFIVDVSNPQTPVLLSTITGVNASAGSTFAVAGRYLYIGAVIDNLLKVFDISNPASPTLAGSVAIGTGAFGTVVSGHFAYVVDQTDDNLKIINISNPVAPTVVSTTALGTVSPKGPALAGRYLAIVDSTTDDLDLWDVASSTVPSLVGSLDLGAGAPSYVTLAGRYAYVTDSTQDNLKIIDLSGIEVTSGIIHSLEAGTLQVREAAAFNQSVSVSGGLNIGAGGIFTSGPLSVSIASSTTADFNNTASTSAYFQGLVGIGTSSPVSTLSIQGSLCVRSTGNCGTTAGNIYLTAGAVTDIDLAENYPIADETLEPGDLVSLSSATRTYALSDGRDRQTIGALVKARASSTLPVLGVISTKPGLLFGYDIKEAPVRPVALAGRVPVKVTGVIEIGDEIAVSDEPGVGRKAGYDEPIVGLALEVWPPASPQEPGGAETVGKIMVFVKLGRARLDPDYAVQDEALRLLASTTATSTPAAQSLVARFFNNIFERITQWFADAANGLKEIWANVFRAREKICIGETCLDEETLRTVIERSQQAPVVIVAPPPPAPPAPEPPPKDEPPPDAPPPTPDADDVSDEEATTTDDVITDDLAVEPPLAPEPIPPPISEPEPEPAPEPLPEPPLLDSSP